MSIASLKRFAPKDMPLLNKQFFSLLMPFFAKTTRSTDFEAYLAVKVLFLHKKSENHSIVFIFYRYLDVDYTSKVISN